MKVRSAVFGIVAGLFAVASPVFNSGGCIAAEGAANGEKDFRELYPHCFDRA